MGTIMRDNTARLHIKLASCLAYHAWRFCMTVSLLRLECRSDMIGTRGGPVLSLNSTAKLYGIKIFCSIAVTILQRPVSFLTSIRLQPTMKTNNCNCMSECMYSQPISERVTGVYVFLTLLNRLALMSVSNLLCCAPCDSYVYNWMSIYRNTEINS